MRSNVANKRDVVSAVEPKNAAASPLLAASLRERMHTAFDATLRIPVQTQHSAPVALERVRIQVAHMSGLAHLYFKQHVPIWPPRLLLRKVVRKIVFPVLWPQIEYNEAIRDCTVEMLASLDAEVGNLREAQQKIRDLEEKVELLEVQLMRLLPQAVSSPVLTNSVKPSVPNAVAPAGGK